MSTNGKKLCRKRAVLRRNVQADLVFKPELEALVLPLLLCVVFWLEDIDLDTHRIIFANASIVGKLGYNRTATNNVLRVTNL
jgi:hypothetical protein